MVDENKLTSDALPWHPIKDAVDLKHLGKLAEELGEGIAVVSRCIIQGIDEFEPVTKVSNRKWLEDELADIQANIILCVNRFNLNTQRIEQRMDKKIKYLRSWHNMA